MGGGENCVVGCALCYAMLPNPYGSKNQPDGGTEFVTSGHYGSGAFDPMDGSALAINICDNCLTDLRKRRLVGIYRNSGFKRWGR